MSSKAYIEVYPHMTEKQKDIMYDLFMKGVNYDGHVMNKFCDIEDAVAGILKEQIASAKTDVTGTYARDTVSRDAAIESVCKMLSNCFNASDEMLESVKITVGELPPAQPTLYGYSIEFLAMMAEIMKKENVGPGEALQLFKSASYIAELIRAEWYENVQRQMEQMFAGGQDDN